MKIFDGFEEIEILPWYECKDCTKHSRFSGRLPSLLFLQRYKASAMAMMSLRRMVLEGGYDVGLPIPDDEVLERVAARLATGELHLIRKPLVLGTGATTPKEEPARIQPIVEPIQRQAAAPPPPLPEEPVFLPNVDLGAIAQVLTQAAASGVPFCEE